MAKHDITKTNAAIDRVLEVTQNPRHRFMLQAYYRHRYLEIAGRYEEIFAPEMMSPEPVYHMQAGKTEANLRGQAIACGRKPISPSSTLRAKRLRYQTTISFR
jgi:hypothetical protein